MCVNISEPMYRCMRGNVRDCVSASELVSESHSVRVSECVSATV